MNKIILMTIACVAIVLAVFVVASSRIGERPAFTDNEVKIPETITVPNVTDKNQDKDYARLIDSVNQLNRAVKNLVDRVERVELSQSKNNLSDRSRKSEKTDAVPGTRNDTQAPVNSTEPVASMDSGPSLDEMYDKYEAKLLQGDRDEVTANRVEMVFNGIDPNLQLGSVQCNDKICKMQLSANDEESAENSVGTFTSTLPWATNASYFISKGSEGLTQITYFFTKENVSEL